MSRDVGTLTLAEVISRAIDNRLVELRVAMPATIESFDPATQLASVKPSLKESVEDEDGEKLVESLPVICDVPVQFPGAGGFSVTFPVERGDPCFLIFSDRSLDRWLSRGGEVDPAVQHRHALSDAVALLGVRAVPGALPAFDTSHVTIGKDGAPADAPALATLVRGELDKIIGAFNTHTHLGVGVAPGAPIVLAPPAPSAPVSASTGSATVKIKG